MLEMQPRARAISEVGRKKRHKTEMWKASHHFELSSYLVRLLLLTNFDCFHYQRRAKWEVKEGILVDV